jgi:hypothetical protein
MAFLVSIAFEIMLYYFAADCNDDDYNALILIIIMPWSREGLG